MISRERYLKLREMTRRYEAARKRFDAKRYERGGGYDVRDRTIISAMAGSRDSSNDEKSQIEEYEWRMFPPSRYFAYYDSAMTKITGFMGNVLGRIVFKGSVTKKWGGKRQNITVRGSNNVMYSGVCNLTGGTYCRLRRIKGRGPAVLPNGKLGAGAYGHSHLRPHFPYRLAKTDELDQKRLSRKWVVYLGMEDRVSGEWARVKLMGHSGEPIGDVLLLRPWLLYKSHDSPMGTSLPLLNKKKSKRPAKRKKRQLTYQEILRHYTRFGKSRRNPRVSGSGSFVRVTMSADDVDRFKSQWPASGLPDRAIWFEFQRSNGDLVDMSPGSERFDGPALVALSQDAQKFAGL